MYKRTKTKAKFKLKTDQQVAIPVRENGATVGREQPEVEEPVVPSVTDDDCRSTGRFGTGEGTLPFTIPGGVCALFPLFLPPLPPPSSPPPPLPTPTPLPPPPLAPSLPPIPTATRVSPSPPPHLAIGSRLKYTPQLEGTERNWKRNYIFI